MPVSCKVSILILSLLSACAMPVVEFPDTGASESSGGCDEPGPTDTHETPDTGSATDTGASDTGASSETGDSGEDSAAEDCPECGGIQVVSSSEISIKADGESAATVEVDLYGWTTGIELRCAATLEHLTWELDMTDTRDTGHAKLTFGTTELYRGSESGLCALTSDYGPPLTLEVTLSPCPECSGITGCDSDELVIWAGYPWTGGFTTMSCNGTATGIAVTCTGIDDPTFYTELDSMDSSSRGVFAFTAGTRTEGLGDSGICTLSSEQAPTVEICVWQCTTSGCLSPC